MSTFKLVLSEVGETVDAIDWFVRWVWSIEDRLPLQAGLENSEPDVQLFLVVIYLVEILCESNKFVPVFG